MNRSVRKLTLENYDTACDLAGDALLRRVPAGSTVLQVTEDKTWSRFSVGVYIAADAQNVIRYVGSTRRARSVADRIQEHVLAGRARTWVRLMVVPLRADTDTALVRRIEGRIGMVLQPLDVARLPSIGRPRPVNRNR